MSQQFGRIQVNTKLLCMLINASTCCSTIFIHIFYVHLPGNSRLLYELYVYVCVTATSLPPLSSFLSYTECEYKLTKFRQDLYSSWSFRYIKLKWQSMKLHRTRLSAQTSSFKSAQLSFRSKMREREKKKKNKKTNHFEKVSSMKLTLKISDKIEIESQKNVTATTTVGKCNNTLCFCHKPFLVCDNIFFRSSHWQSERMSSEATKNRLFARSGSWWLTHEQKKSFVATNEMQWNWRLEMLSIVFAEFQQESVLQRILLCKSNRGASRCVKK